MAEHSLSNLPGSLSSSPHPETFQILQEQIIELEKIVDNILHKISSLKFQQNQLTSIGSLPDDILAEVFSHFVYTGVGTHAASVKWIREATHVCSRWRRIAVQSPRLWSRPSFISPELTAAMITRAKATPLEFVIDLDDEFDDRYYFDDDWIGYDDQSERHLNIIALVIKNLPRARSLILDERGERYGKLDHFATRCAREPSFNPENLSLESVKISVDRCSNNYFPIEILEITSSKLRSVHLRNWNLFWVGSPDNLSWLSGISQLDITVASRYETHQKSDVRQVVSCLEALPQLRTLILRNIFATPRKGSRTSPGPIIQASQSKGPLPVLDRLVLESYPDLCGSFLTQIGCAPKTSLTVHCQGDIQKALKGDFQQLVSTIRGIVANPDKVTETHRSILYQADVQSPIH